MLAPPRDVPPERLFRLLLRRPRPVLPLVFRFAFAPHVALAVRGLTAYEDAEISDVPPDDPTGRSLIARRLIAAVLLADGRPAFTDADAVGGLTEHEIAALGDAVVKAAHVVSPMRNKVDLAAWDDALQKGARHPQNIGVTMAIAAATEPLVAPQKLLRLSAPERYFGAPIADLTDGQLLAYYAAKAAMDKAS